MLAFSVSTLPPAPTTDVTDAASTPLMRQYWAAKRQNPDALLFFRMGDFYELFFEDAQVAARELQITLTARDKERSVPMCGVPYHAADNYLSRLLRKGYRVAICEQMEDPKLTKKIVRREVTRVLTPGTAIDPSLASERNNYLAALHLGAYLGAGAARPLHRRLSHHGVQRAGEHRFLYRRIAEGPAQRNSAFLGTASARPADGSRD